MAPVLTAVHWAYLATIVVVIFLMIRRRDVVLPCLAGSFVVALLYKGSFIGAVQGIFNGLMEAGTDLFDIMLVIALMVAMLQSLRIMGADYKMIAPVRRFMSTPSRAFFILGSVMYVAAIFFWPTPATALVGTLLIPVAIASGLPAMGAAMAVNIMGHGMALSGDLVIQGALKLSSEAAGIEVQEIFIPAAILSLVAGLTATGVAFLMVRREMNSAKTSKMTEMTATPLVNMEEPEFGRYAGLFALAVPILMFLVVVIMVTMKIRGGSATALLGGTAVLILFAATVLQSPRTSLEDIVGHLRHGLLFAIKIFAPVIPIAGFFFLGSQGAAQHILGEGAPGLLYDLGRSLAACLPLGKVPLAFGNLIVGIVTGLDGSGFSGLPLTGALAQALGTPLSVNVPVLASIGQMGAIWAGGGTLVAWSFGLVATAGIAGVDPLELARKNFIPVLAGLMAATGVGIFMM